jgi:predicted DNA-binding transcriptional regulator AlpA
MPVLAPQSHAAVEPRLLDEKRAAAYLSVSLSTMVRWRKARTGPAFLRVGNVLRYDRQQLDRFIANNTQQPTQEKKQ